MKRLTLLLTTVAILATATAQKSTVDCTLRGAAGMRVVVSEARGGRLVPVDTLIPDVKGRFHVERALADPLMMAFHLTGDGKTMLHVLMMPKEHITLEVDYMPAISLLNITSAKGSENMALYKEYTNMAAELVTSQRTDLMPGRLQALLEAHPDVLMSAFLVTYYEQAFEQYAPLYKKIRDALIGRYPENEFVRHLDGRLQSAVLQGMEAPDIALPDPDGKVRRLSDLRGKVVLIDFWASWCGPCRMENPNVVRLYHAYHDKGFEVFSVSLDKSRDSWVKAIKDDHLDWPNHVSDLKYWSSAGGRLYGITSIPSTVLVGPDGTILARNLRGQELERKLMEIFAQ